MYCRKCGNVIPEGMNVCAYCGTPVQETENTAGGENNGSVYREQAPSYSGQSPNPSYSYQNQGYGTPQNMDGGARGLGIASMVLGIIALLIACWSAWWLTIILAVLSIVFGIISIQKNDSGKGMSIAGIVCSAVALLMGVLVVALGVALVTWIVALFS